MIDREIINNPEKPFDFFNDYPDTAYWLYKLHIGKLNPAAEPTLARLEQRLAEYNKTADWKVESMFPHLPK